MQVDIVSGYCIIRGCFSVMSSLSKLSILSSDGGSLKVTGYVYKKVFANKIIQFFVIKNGQTLTCPSTIESCHCFIICQKDIYDYILNDYSQFIFKTNVTIFKVFNHDAYI